MQDLKPPFRFDFNSLITQTRQRFDKRIEGIEINLPFVTFVVRPNDLECKIAREIVIRLVDRRVLNACECCDNCIDQALASLQEIRSMLVDKQVELSSVTDSSLYVLIQFMLDAIRQFLTFEQRLLQEEKPPELYMSSDFRRPRETRELYFSALEMIRAHLHRCLKQAANIGGMEIPKISPGMRYDDNWQHDAYLNPVLPE